MALIPPFYLDAVVAIGVGDDIRHRFWIGTGFFYGWLEKESEDGKKQYKIFLVTNRHVLEGHKKIWIKLNSASDQTSQDYPIDLIAKNGKPRWAGHPDEQIDIAAFWVNASAMNQEKRKYSYFCSDSHIWNLNDMRENQISEGDGLFVLGFPMSLVDSTRQYVICRSGSISRIRDAIDNRGKDFLIDALVFPGNSGGPVVSRPNLTAIEGTKAIKSANLLGIVSSYLPYQDHAISQQTRRPRISFEENSGLASVIPSDFITETVKVARTRILAKFRRHNKKLLGQPKSP